MADEFVSLLLCTNGEHRPQHRQQTHTFFKEASWCSKNRYQVGPTTAKTRRWDSLNRPRLPYRMHLALAPPAQWYFPHLSIETSRVAIVEKHFTWARSTLNGYLQAQVYGGCPNFYITSHEPLFTSEQQAPLVPVTWHISYQSRPGVRSKICGDVCIEGRGCKRVLATLQIPPRARYGTLRKLLWWKAVTLMSVCSGRNYDFRCINVVF